MGGVNHSKLILEIPGRKNRLRERSFVCQSQSLCHELRVHKLHPADQIQATTCFVYKLLWEYSRTHSFIYCIWQQHSWVVLIETLYPEKPNILTIWPFTGNVCQPLSQTTDQARNNPWVRAQGAILSLSFHLPTCSETREKQGFIKVKFYKRQLILQINVRDYQEWGYLCQNPIRT